MDLQHASNDQITGTILIVDNSLDARRLRALLTQAGHQVQYMTTGQQGLQNIILELPDLILLDMELPDMTGYELCRQLKAIDNTQDIPIIFLDTSEESLYKVQAFRLGAADYITKPFDAVDVLVRVEMQLRARQRHQSQAHLQVQNCQLQLQVSHLLSDLSTLEKLNQELVAKLQTYQAEPKTSRLSQPVAFTDDSQAKIGLKRVSYGHSTVPVSV